MVNVQHFTKTLDDVRRCAVEHLRPPPIETLPQWIERAVRLLEGLSAGGSDAMADATRHY